MDTKIEIYKDTNGEFRWRAKRKGRIVCDSGEGYKREATLKRVVSNLFSSKIIFIKLLTSK